jgi:hypothetical protein
VVTKDCVLESLLSKYRTFSAALLYLLMDWLIMINRWHIYGINIPLLACMLVQDHGTASLTHLRASENNAIYDCVPLGCIELVYFGTTKVEMVIVLLQDRCIYRNADTTYVSTSYLSLRNLIWSCHSKLKDSVL